jgi:hypothetical protein
MVTKKIKLLFFASLILFLSSCGHYYSCPTYSKAPKAQPGLEKIEKKEIRS